MTVEDKALLKFQKQRRKKELYNLKDAESGDGGLTHMGQSLSEAIDAAERRKRYGAYDDDEEDGSEKVDANKPHGRPRCP